MMMLDIFLKMNNLQVKIMGNSAVPLQNLVVSIPFNYLWPRICHISLNC